MRIYSKEPFWERKGIHHKVFTCSRHENDLRHTPFVPSLAPHFAHTVAGRLASACARAFTVSRACVSTASFIIFCDCNSVCSSCRVLPACGQTLRNPHEPQTFRTKVQPRSTVAQGRNHRPSAVKYLSNASRSQSVFPARTEKEGEKQCSSHVPES